MFVLWGFPFSCWVSRPLFVFWFSRPLSIFFFFLSFSFLFFFFFKGSLSFFPPVCRFQRMRLPTDSSRWPTKPCVAPFALSPWPRVMIPKTMSSRASAEQALSMVDPFDFVLRFCFSSLSIPFLIRIGVNPSFTVQHVPLPALWESKGSSSTSSRPSSPPMASPWLMWCKSTRSLRRLFTTSTIWVR